MRAPALLLLVLGLPLSAAAATLACGPDSGGNHEVAIRGDANVTFGSVPTGALWRLEEMGTDLTVRVTPTGDPSAAGQSVPVGSRPLRLGITYGAASAGLALEVRAEGGATATVGRLELICSPNVLEQAEAACLGAAGVQRPPAEARIWAMQHTASCAATALYGAATLAYRQGQPAVAASLYAEADALWIGVADQARSGAARLGQAEAAWRQGRHQEALELSQSAQAQAEAAGAAYLSARSLQQSCLALRGIGRMANGAACQQEVIDRYQRLGEADAAANALLSAAAMAREDGRRGDLEHLSRRMSNLDGSTLVPFVRGRGLHFRAGLALDQGEFQSALALLAEAMDAFESVPSPLWLAASNLQAARVHAALGSQQEAVHLARAAADGFRSIGMPEREGGAWLLMARVHADAGAAALAMAAADMAAERYQEAARPQLRLASALVALTVDPTPGRLAEVEALVDAATELPQRMAFDLDLTRARLALGQGQGAFALERMMALESRVTDLPRWMALMEAQAEAERTLGRTASARERLERAMLHMRQQADAVDSPALAHMAARRMRRLAAAWIDTLAESEVGNPQVIEQVGRLLLGTHPASWLGGRLQVPSSRQGDVLRQLLAEAMVGEDSAVAEALEVAEVQRLLWQWPNGSATRRVEDVQAWERVLPRATADHPVLLIGLGRHQGVSLLLGGSAPRMWLIPDVPDLRAQVDHVRTGAVDPSHPVHALDAAALRLSARLLSGQLEQPPRNLSLVVDDVLTGLPFALLPWPGADSPLVETTRLTHVLPVARAPAGASSADGPLSLQVLVAGDGRGSAHGLPILQVAVREPALVAATRPDLSVVAEPLSLRTLREALESPGSKLHVAGHGSVLSGVQGFSGLWGVPQADGRPSFISWLEFAGRPLQAELLVLNACALGSDGNGAGEAAANFAQVVHASGVRDVVAALWPVSDSAGALWVPAFYRALEQDPADVADAVRQAQLRLRESRAFRHPYYWASLAHWGQL